LASNCGALLIDRAQSFSTHGQPAPQEPPFFVCVSVLLASPCPWHA